MNIYLLIKDQFEMENLPKTIIDILNSQLKSNTELSWRVHGMQDKVVMNIMWSNSKLEGDSSDYPQKKFTLSSMVSGRIGVSASLMTVLKQQILD